jgi:hypothetical protein
MLDPSSNHSAVVGLNFSLSRKDLTSTLRDIERCALPSGMQPEPCGSDFDYRDCHFQLWRRTKHQVAAKPHLFCLPLMASCMVTCCNTTRPTNGDPFASPIHAKMMSISDALCPFILVVQPISPYPLPAFWDVEGTVT